MTGISVCGGRIRQTGCSRSLAVQNSTTASFVLRGEEKYASSACTSASSTPHLSISVSRSWGVRAKAGGGLTGEPTSVRQSKRRSEGAGDPLAAVTKPVLSIIAMAS